MYQMTSTHVLIWINEKQCSKKNLKNEGGQKYFMDEQGMDK